MNFPWWAWGLLVVLALLLVLAWAAALWRGLVRRELVEYLSREAPELTVVREQSRSLILRDENGEVVFNLHNVLEQVGQLDSEDKGGRQAVYAEYLRAFRDAPRPGNLDPDRDRERLRPRLLPTAEVAALTQGRSGAGEVPSVETGVPGLFGIVVVDAPTSVLYADKSTLEELGLDVHEAWEIAVANLAPSLPIDLVQEAVRSNALQVVKSLDSYDAARLLVVPGLLVNGQQVLAFAPDRDTLVLTAVPEEPDPEALRRLARNAAGPPLWREPIMVTADGLAPVGRELGGSGAD